VAKSKPTPSSPPEGADVRTEQAGPLPGSEAPSAAPAAVGAAVEAGEADLTAALAEIERLKAERAKHERAADEGRAYIRELQAKLTAATPPAAPAAQALDHGFGKWLVHVPGHTHAPREVEARTAAEAVEKYKAEMGIVSFPAAPLAEKVSHPQLPAPALAPLTPAE
jgi:hypothetical protein